MPPTVAGSCYVFSMVPQDIIDCPDTCKSMYMHIHARGLLRRQSGLRDEPQALRETSGNLEQQLDMEGLTRASHIARGVHAWTAASAWSLSWVL